MTSIKVKFRPSTVPDAPGSIYYQLIKDRNVRRLSTEYRIFLCEWDEKSMSVAAGCDDSRRQVLASVREYVKWDMERLARIVRELERTGIDYDLDRVISDFNWFVDRYSLFNYMESTIHRLRRNGKVRTSENYRATLNSFRRFRKGEDIMLDALSSEIMEDFESWLRDFGLSSNTVSFYMRILRAVYNRAVEENVIENRNPFRRVYTGVDKTAKRALPLSAIRKLRELDLPPGSPLDHARNMFMLSFYFRGMSFIDMAFLKKSDLHGGSVTYCRRKTGQRLEIGWTSAMQEILDKYPGNESQYLLPILKIAEGGEWAAYRRAGYNINFNLKKIGGKIGLDFPLTMYVARHSWASAAKTKGVPLSVISSGMGHDSESTTKIYLASFDRSLLDEANDLIISGLE